MLFRKLSFLSYTALAFLVIGFVSCTPLNHSNNNGNNNSSSTYSSDYLFDINAVPEIKLTVELDDWNELLNNYDIN